MSIALCHRAKQKGAAAAAGHQSGQRNGSAITDSLIHSFIHLLVPFTKAHVLVLCQRLRKDKPVRGLGSEEVKGHRLAGAVCTKELPAAICAEELPAETAD